MLKSRAGVGAGVGNHDFIEVDAREYARRKSVAKVGDVFKHFQSSWRFQFVCIGCLVHPRFELRVIFGFDCHDSFLVFYCVLSSDLR